MLKHQHQFSQKIPIECPLCLEIIECRFAQISAGESMTCPHCRSAFECRSRELFTALKHIHEMAI